MDDQTIDPSTFKPLGSNPSQAAPQGSPSIDSSTFKPIGGAAPPSTQGASMGAASGPGAGDYFVHDPNESTLQTVGRDIGGVVEGAGMGVMHGVSGLLHIGDTVSNKVRSTLGMAPEDHTNILSAVDNAAGIGASHGRAQNFGYGGETLAEFIGGDAALKTATESVKALTTGKILATLEKSPRLIEALKTGVKQLAKQAAEAAAVQGTQSFVRSGGDVQEAAKDAAITAGTVGVLGGASGAVGHAVDSAAGKLAEAGKTAGELADTATQAPSSQTVNDNIKGQLVKSERDLHQNYEDKTKDFVGRLDGTTIDPKEAPIAKKAQQLLEAPDPEDHSSVAELKDALGEKLDPKVRSFIENTANGTKPISEEAQADVDEANKTAADAHKAAVKDAKSKPALLDASGKPIKATPLEAPEPLEAEPEDQEPHDANSLIQWRQKVRKLAESFPPGDVNSRALKSLLWDSTDHSSAFDDTFKQLADEGGDPSVAKEYGELRDDYRNKINRYDSPVIKNLMAGKPDDAANSFIQTLTPGVSKGGTKNFNLNDLNTLIGPEATKSFGKDVLYKMMNHSAEGGAEGFNAANFVKKLDSISPETKQGLFGAAKDVPKIGPQTLYDTYAKDAKTVANVQKLVRAGLLGGTGAAALLANAALPAPIVGAFDVMLGIAIGKGGKGAGKELIDNVANNPKLWKRFQNLQGTAGGTVAKAVTKTGAAIANINAQPDRETNPYAASVGALGGDK